MPFYFYRHTCGFSGLLRRSIAEHVLDQCPGCSERAMLRPVITREHAPNIMLSAVTNHVYNNGQGRYDVGLGCRVHSRQEHRQRMKELGVTEFTGTYEDFMKEQQREPKEITIPQVKDTVEEAFARYDRGERYNPPDPPTGITPKDITDD